MSELEPQPRGKFVNPIAEALYSISLNGWCNEQSGSVEWGLWFARISITGEELAEVAEAFEETLQEVGLSPISLVGHRLLKEDEAGFVDYDEFDSEEELKRDYEQLEAEYSQWADEAGDALR